MIEHQVNVSFLRWWVSNCTQAEQEQTLVKSSSELEIENMFGVFLVLIGSVVLAVIVEIGKRIRQEVEKKYEEKKKNKEQVIFCTCYWYSVRKEGKQRTGNILYLLLV